MESEMELTAMLDLMTQPAFCVKDRKIAYANQSAAKLLLEPGMPVDNLICHGQELYSSTWDGSLYVTLTVCGCEFGAAVTHVGDWDVFTLDTDAQEDNLSVLSLAARELRSPLASAIAASHRMEASDTVSLLNRSLYQLLRIIGNMSDAAGSSPIDQTECRYVDGFLREVFEKASALAQSTGIALSYSGLTEDVLTSIDVQLLERAALNMISNALKFTPKGGSIQCSLTRREQYLYLQVSDNGPGIPDEILGTVFRRHLRQSAIEDGRFGIGLGMLLIRKAAARHGGAVLIDRPDGTGTRVTMTIAIRPACTILRQHPFRIDYAGELDHALIELSDCLEADQY